MVRNAAIRRGAGQHDLDLRYGAKPASPEVAFYKERLRGLASQLLLAEERERERLAVDLHDGLSQLIALAQIKLSCLAGSADKPLEKPLAELRHIIDEANRSVRSLTYQLNPPILHDGKLSDALQWLADDIGSRYGLAIELTDEGGGVDGGRVDGGRVDGGRVDGGRVDVDERCRSIVFRAVRELLINAAKHARATRVRVELRRGQDGLRILVADDGVGMSPSVKPKGCGLVNIRERLVSLGGDLRIDSAPGRGTRIHLAVPHLRQHFSRKAV